MNKDTVFVPRGALGNLFKEEEGLRHFVQGQTLYRNFHIGIPIKVGESRSGFAVGRHLTTSNAMDILSITELDDKTDIKFKTRNSVYVLQVKTEDMQYRDTLLPVALSVKSEDESKWFPILLEFVKETDND